MAGRIDPASLETQLNTYMSQTQAARQQAIAQRQPTAAPANIGPTSKWARFAQVGASLKQKADALLQFGKQYELPAAKKTLRSEGHAAGAVGRFLAGGTARLTNTAISEGRQVANTAEMLAAAKTKNAKAFSNAQRASQVNYQQANKPRAGILNAGTVFKNPKEAQSGELKTGLKRIGGGTLATAGEVLPLAEFEKAAKLYQVGKGLVKTGELAKAVEQLSKAQKIFHVVKESATGAAILGTGSAGSQLVSEGKVSPGETAKAAASGSIPLPASLKYARKGVDELLGKLKGKAATEGEKVVEKATEKATPKVMKGVEKLAPKTEQKSVLSRLKKPTTEAAAKVEGESITARMMKPGGAPKVREPLVNTNKPVKSLVNKLTLKSLKGKVNPVDAAARAGHTAFSTLARSVAGKKIYALREGHNISNKFDKLYADYLVKGGTHQQFIKDIESGNLTSEAHKLFAAVHEKAGAQMAEHGVIKGARENYVPRVGQFTEKGYKKGGGGLTKSGSFSKARAQIADEFGFASDKFKTHAEYKNFVEANGGKVLSDPRDIMRHTLPSKLEAIENAKGLERLDKTPMADGRPATITFNASKGLPKNYTDYSTQLINGRAVHPEAVGTLKALVHRYTPEEIHNPIARANSFAKQVITFNGLIHGKNFGLASMRSQGGIHTAAALTKVNKTLEEAYGSKNVERMIVKGHVVPFEQAKQDMFDKIGQPTKNIARNTWDKVVHFPGKVAEAERNFLFNKVGNHLQASTYFNVEKQMLKKGLSADEAARVAGQAAKNVSFISSPVETSVEFRKTSRYLAFAGQYFKSTLNELGKATGISSDKSLSSKAQHEVQKNAIKGIVRGTTYLMALAQGINYATTGHSTFQNKGSKISPVFYVDKTTGKEYHITNWFGQLGDMMHLLSNPIQELSNKASPMLQEGSKIYQAIQSGAPDPYTGQTIIDKNAPGWRQTSQAIGNFAENMFSPMGFQLSNTQRSTPGMVNFAKFLGYGASTVDRNAMETDIMNQYYATLPSGANKTPPKTTLLETSARNDLAHGRTSSPSLTALKSQMSSKQFSAFTKTGAESDVQRAFDKLPTDQKFKLIEKYSPQQLKELDFTGVEKSLVDSSSRSTIQALQAKGVSTQQMQQDLNKIGATSGQLSQLKAEAKKQAKISSAKARHAPKFRNPFVR